MPERTNGDKRRLLLDAAVRVFARKGYHAARVGDIAEEAGVAYGLLYHYFESKEDVLRSVFRETWRALIATIKSVEEGDDPPREQLRKVAEILLRSWKRDPDLVRVLVLEVTRSGHLAGEMDEIGIAPPRAEQERGDLPNRFGRRDAGRLDLAHTGEHLRPR